MPTCILSKRRLPTSVIFGRKCGHLSALRSSSPFCATRLPTRHLNRTKFSGSGSFDSQLWLWKSRKRLQPPRDLVHPVRFLVLECPAFTYYRLLPRYISLVQVPVLLKHRSSSSCSSARWRYPSASFARWCRSLSCPVWLFNKFSASSFLLWLDLQGLLCVFPHHGCHRCN